MTQQLQQLNTGGGNFKRNNNSNTGYHNRQFSNQQIANNQQQYNNRQTKVICYSCGMPGHVVRNCPSRTNNPVTGTTTTHFASQPQQPQQPQPNVNSNSDANTSLTQIQQMLAQLVSQESSGNQSLN